MNSEKTHLIVIASNKQHKLNGDFGISLSVGSGKTILPTSTEKLLGGFISNDLKWNEQIRGNTSSIFNSVVSSSLLLLL